MADVFKRAIAMLGGPAAAKTKVDAPKRPVNPYHAVTIAPGAQACAAALGLKSRRFLSREAPVLPLKNCDYGGCECRYEHHADRRKGPRRANELAICIDGYDGPEHRSGTKRGRRKSDRKT